MKFRKGDRVIIVRRGDFANGNTGTIVIVDKERQRYGLDLGQDFRHGHGLNGSVPGMVNSGWWVMEEYLVLTPSTPFERSLSSYITRELPDA